MAKLGCPKTYLSIGVCMMCCGCDSVLLEALLLGQQIQLTGFNVGNDSSATIRMKIVYDESGSSRMLNTPDVSDLGILSPGEGFSSSPSCVDNAGTGVPFTVFIYAEDDPDELLLSAKYIQTCRGAGVNNLSVIDGPNGSIAIYATGPNGVVEAIAE